MQIAIVGCGFVADFYINTLRDYPNLTVVGVMDCNPDRAAQFGAYHNLPIYPTLSDLLGDSRVELVLNLTNPRSHFEVSQACLEAGKHVYSEKPLAMTFQDAQTLFHLAQAKNLLLSCAPCNLLSETAQTLWKALREQVVGTVRLVYAEMDDGLLHTMPYRQWKSSSGTPWPAKDEFEVGCTIEHAAYYVTWLAAFFGPVTSLTAFASCQVADKQTDLPLEPSHTPDFSVACLQFANGVVARLTCSIVAPHDHKLQIIGDGGILSTRDCWFYNTPVVVRRSLTLRRKTFLSPLARQYPLVRSSQRRQKIKKGQQMDYARGVAELAEAIQHQRPCRLSAEFVLHVNEVVLAIQNATSGLTYQPTTTFAPIDPMPWALE
ncbi:MAG: Gfo/Idh/MocA family oxidoreductase [Thermosynechococcaceae cyanobacterium MS004]|nr:Gfo/Idh/MocA family oxidoreductase [Thermosynechococcaceae cyanobacterium MS004]